MLLLVCLRDVSAPAISRSIPPRPHVVTAKKQKGKGKKLRAVFPASQIVLLLQRFQSLRVSPKAEGGEMLQAG